jgi:hypothetical protein
MVSDERREGSDRLQSTTFIPGSVCGELPVMGKSARWSFSRARAVGAAMADQSCP